MNEFAKPNLAVDQIPPSSSLDAGKALVVGESGVPGWAEVGGGSGGGALVVNCAYDEETGEDVFDKTWAEINDAPLAVVRKSGNGFVYSEIVSYCFSDYDDEKEADVYFVITMRADLENGNPKVVALKYVADSPNDFPYYSFD